MNGSSLCMAPAMVLAQLWSFVDLEGPLLRAEDIENEFEFDHARVERTHVPDLWG